MDKTRSHSETIPKLTKIESSDEEDGEDIVEWFPHQPELRRYSSSSLHLHAIRRFTVIHEASKPSKSQFRNYLNLIIRFRNALILICTPLLFAPLLFYGKLVRFWSQRGKKPLEQYKFF